MNVLAIVCLWIGFWLGRRHERAVRDPDAHYLPIIKQMREAARNITRRKQFVGEGAFISTWCGKMTVDGKIYHVAMMEHDVRREWIPSLIKVIDA